MPELPLLPSRRGPLPSAYVVYDAATFDASNPLQKPFIPPLTNEMVILIKDTSLYFVLGTTIATKELTKFGNDFMSATFNGTPLVVIALVYLAITLPLTRFVAQLEKRAARAR